MIQHISTPSKLDNRLKYTGTTSNSINKHMDCSIEMMEIVELQQSNHWYLLWLLSESLLQNGQHKSWLDMAIKLSAINQLQSQLKTRYPLVNSHSYRKWDHQKVRWFTHQTIVVFQFANGYFLTEGQWNNLVAFSMSSISTSLIQPHDSSSIQRHAFRSCLLHKSAKSLGAQFLYREGTRLRHREMWVPPKWWCWKYGIPKPKTVYNWFFSFKSMCCPELYPLVNCHITHNYGKSPCFIGNSTISMVIFHSYVKVYQRV